MIQKNELNKKEQIIITAINLFVNQGFENTPTSQITKKANVGTGTLFYHFKTKEELINSAYLYAKRKMSKDIFNGFKKNTNSKTKLSLMWENILKWAIKNKEMNNFILKFRNSIYIKNLTLKEIKIEFKEAKDLLRDGIKNKEIKNLPEDLIEEIFLNLYQVFLNRFQNKKALTKKEITQSFQIAWDAIKYEQN